MAIIPRLSSTFFILALALALALAFDVSSVTANFPQSAGATYKPEGGEGSLTKQECPNACEYRCSETHHRKPCLFFCNKCCETCLCVPSGTSGNKEECPCYNNWKTQQGTPKCP